MKWQRLEPGTYRWGPYEIRRETVGSMFSRELWVVYHDGVRDTRFSRRQHLARAKADVANAVEPAPPPADRPPPPDPNLPYLWVTKGDGTGAWMLLVTDTLDGVPTSLDDLP